MGYRAELRKVATLAPKSGQTDASPWKFNVPDGERSLLFGSFDNLIRLTDDLQKADNSVDSVVHRLERQYLELEPTAQFKVKSQRQEKSLADYLRTWQWDEAKYPRTRAISDNLTLLMSVVNKLDEEARNKTASYTEYKSQKANIAKKDGASLTNRELVDLLTPDVVNTNGGPDDDFISTEFLSTVCVVLPRGSEKEFLEAYETFHNCIVPMSAKHFKSLDDKDGNSLWRVVMFKTAVEDFKKKCREKRYIIRDFEYSEEGYKRLKTQREQIEDAVRRQHEIVRGLYSAAWSDAMIAWVHVKAMRVFVESVLRYGMPPCFAAYIVSPKPGQASNARKALADILGKQGNVGPVGDKMAAGEDDDSEEYFPYVSFSFTPFQVPREGKSSGETEFWG